MLIKVKVFPESKRKTVFKKSEDSFEVRVKSKPVMGEANREVIRILALYFKISQSKVRLIRGHKQSNKIFEIAA